MESSVASKSGRSIATSGNGKQGEDLVLERNPPRDWDIFRCYMCKRSRRHPKRCRRLQPNVKCLNFMRKEPSATRVKEKRCMCRNFLKSCFKCQTEEEVALSSEPTESYAYFETNPHSRLYNQISCDMNDVCLRCPFWFCCMHDSSHCQVAELIDSDETTQADYVTSL